eukprot:2952694-Prymnesium_polylepis.1
MCCFRARSIPSISNSVVVSIRRLTAKVGGSNPCLGAVRRGFAACHVVPGTSALISLQRPTAARGRREAAR